MKETPASVSGHTDVFSQYSLGQLISVEAMNPDVFNSSSKVMTSSGEYFLREHDSGALLETVQNEVGLINFLGANEIPVPKIIENNHGEFIFNLNHRLGFISEYVRGDFFPKKGTELNLPQLINAAETLARYHRFIEKYKEIPAPASSTHFTVEKFFSKQKAREIWETAFSLIAGKKITDEIDKRLTLIGKEKIAQIEAINDSGLNDRVKQLPAVLAHGDYLPQNLIFQGNKVVAITDWEMARYQPRVWELIRAVCGFSKKGPTEIFNTPLDIVRAKLFIESYEKINPLSSEEKTVMFELAYTGSLYPLFLLKSRYIKGSNRADFLMPTDNSDWNWWLEKRSSMRNLVFGF